MVETVCVGLKPAPLRLHKDEVERLEQLLGAQPDELVFARPDVRHKMLGKLRANPAVDAVGGDDQIRFTHLLYVIDLGREFQLDAQAFGAFFEYIE